MIKPFRFKDGHVVFSPWLIRTSRVLVILATVLWVLGAFALRISGSANAHANTFTDERECILLQTVQCYDDEAQKSLPIRAKSVAAINRVRGNP